MSEQRAGTGIRFIFLFSETVGFLVLQLDDRVMNRSKKFNDQKGKFNYLLMLLVLTKRTLFFKPLVAEE